MFELVVVVRKRTLGVVGWVDEDALDAAPVKGQQCLQGFEVVAVDEQVVGAAALIALAAAAVVRHGVQQAVGHLIGNGEGGGAVEPVEGGHAG